MVRILLMRYLGIVWGPGYPREQVGPFFLPIFQRGARAGPSRLVFIVSLSVYFEQSVWKGLPRVLRPRACSGNPYRINKKGQHERVRGMGMAAEEDEMEVGSDFIGA